MCAEVWRGCNELVVSQRGAQVEERRSGWGEDSVRGYKPRLSRWVIGVLSGAIRQHIAGVCSPAAPHRECAQWGHGLKHQPQTPIYCSKLPLPSAEHHFLHFPLPIIHSLALHDSMFTSRKPTKSLLDLFTFFSPSASI